MARFNYSGVAITGGTGRLNSSLGGTVLLKNGVVRNYVTPTNPQTPSQMLVQSIFAALNSYWSNAMVESARAAWEAAASTGEFTSTDTMTGTPRTISSGKELFVTINMNTFSANRALNIQELPQTKEDPGDAAIGAFTMDDSGNAALVYTGSLEANEKLVIEATPPLSAGVQRIRKSLLRYIATNAGASPVDLTATYNAVFGAVDGQAGRKVFVRAKLVNISTGQVKDLGNTSTIIIVA